MKLSMIVEKCDNENKETQNNDTQHNDSQHNGKKCDTRQKQHSK
jgi:hypothetical protein